MNPNTEKALARQEEIVVKEMPGEVLVYDLRQHKAHCLNKTAAMVWSHCDGETTVAEMATRMTEELAAPIGEEVVWLALDQLGKANLLQQPIAKPEDIMRVSRRAALRSLAAVVALPLVVTIVAPPAVAGGSCVEEGSNGNCPTGSIAGQPCGKDCKKCCGTNGACVAPNSANCP